MRLLNHNITSSVLGLSFLNSPSVSIDAFPNHQAFVPRDSLMSTPQSASSLTSLSMGTVVEVETTPIPGMRPGTSGLRKKVEIWQAVDDANKNYVENFIQSLVDAAKDANGGVQLDTMLVAGDGRYYNPEAIQIILRVLAANGVSQIWIPRHGIMSTPAVSAALRRRSSGQAQGAIVLTASHNPGGPGQDFGIKYNRGLGEPAGEDFTEDLWERSKVLDKFWTVLGGQEVDLGAKVGTQFGVGASTVTIVDPFDEYLDALRECFDFQGLKDFGARDGFSLLFDGMHGAGGPFARRILVEELGLPESSLLRCNPLPDFGKCHPDPNLTYASDLIQKMGLNPDGSANPTSPPTTSLPTLGAANDGDGDRNLIAGARCFVTPSDSLAILLDHWKSIPHFARAGGPKGVARSMPSSAALDAVAEAQGIPCFVTPTGWKYFGNLMGSKEAFGGTDYTPFLCGEESFGTGSDHIREKDGIWAVLAWMSVLKGANEGLEEGEAMVGVNEIVTRHWATYGRHFYCRYDYEGVEVDDANEVMDLIRSKYVNGDVVSIPDDESGIKLIDATEFSYTDPVDGSQTSNQGLILNFEYASGNAARVIFRLSGTGSAGATVRMYLERFEKDPKKHDESAPVALKSLADRALGLVKMAELTGRESPTVVT